MPLVNTQKLLLDAQAGHYAVPAINFENAEMLEAILLACKDRGSPVILQTSENTLKYFKYPSRVQQIVSAYALEFDIPISLHLDHGTKIDTVKACLDAQYNSVMFDGSKLEYEQNILQTRKAVSFAKAHRSAPVEGELGHVAGKNTDLEPGAYGYTDPKLAAEYVRATGISSLAVAIGNVHGFYHGEPQLDIDLLKRIRNEVSVPLVLHGASGLSKDQLAACIENGISKINFATTLRAAFTNAVREYLVQFPNVIDPKAFLTSARQEVYFAVLDILEMCLSVGRC